MTWGKGRGGRPWRRLVARVKRRDNYQCQICKRPQWETPDIECDHIVPVSQGGTDAMSNLRMLCKECHAEVTRAQIRAATSKKVQIGVDGWPIK